MMARGILTRRHPLDIDDLPDSEFVAVIVYGDNDQVIDVFPATRKWWDEASINTDSYLNELQGKHYILKDGFKTQAEVEAFCDGWSAF